MSFCRLIRGLLPPTLTLVIAIAPAAIIGLRKSNAASGVGLNRVTEIALSAMWSVPHTSAVTTIPTTQATIATVAAQPKILSP